MHKQYQDRDVIGQDRAGGYYCRHVGAMTDEALHSKSDIAAELAHRDMEIDRLRGALEQSVNSVKELLVENAKLREALQKARDELAGLPRSLGYSIDHLPAIDAALAV